MPRFRSLKNSLLGGQISRDALGRIDLPQYAHSCELLQNMIPLLSGGAYRRPGTIFQDMVPSLWTAATSPLGSEGPANSSPPRLFPFIVDNKNSYALLIGTNRWAKNQGNAFQGPSNNAGGAYLRSFRVTANTTAGVSAAVQFDGGLPYRCKSKNAATTATGQSVYTRQGGVGAVANTGTNIGATATILDVADSLATYDDDIWSVQFCQANDVMFLTHPDYSPQVIYLVGTDVLFGGSYDFNLTGLAFAQSRPYLNQNSTAVTMAASWTGASAPAGTTGTVTASANFFNALHGPRVASVPEGVSAAPVNGVNGTTDGAIIAIAVGTGSAMTGNNTDNGIIFALVTSVVSATVANVIFFNGVPSNYAKATAKTAWWESAWSNYRGWPRACAIYQNRLCFASNAHQPSSLWFTAVGVYGTPKTADGTLGCKFTALGDGPNQGYKNGTTGTLANGQAYTTPANWVYYPVDDSQGDGQSTGPLGSQPFRVSLATTSLDAIQYLSPDQQLFIGTASQEWIGAPENGSFDVANSVFTTQSHYGSDSVQAVRIGYELMFVHQKKDEIRAYQYNYFDQSFFGEPVQLFFDEYPTAEGGVVGSITNPYAGRRKYRQIDWDSSRSTLWCVDTSGNLFGITRDRKLQITTWHTHQLGGYNASHGVGQDITDDLTAGNNYTDSGNFVCDGSVISVCSTPNPLGGVRDLWMVVKRSVGSTTVYSIERMVGANTVRESVFSVVAPGNAQEPYGVDCAQVIADHGTPANKTYQLYVGGFGLFDGVSIVGVYYSLLWGMFRLDSDAAVSSNTFTFQGDMPPDYGDLTKTHTIVVGLPYTPIIKPVRPDPPSPIGSSQGGMKRVSKLYARVFKTLMFQAGAPPPGALEVVQWDPPPNLGQGSEIFTGDKEVFLPTTYDRDGYVYLLQDQPFPFTLVSLSLEGQEYEP